MGVLAYALGVLSSSCRRINGDLPEPPPRETTPHGLMEHPGYYAGTRVKVRTTRVWKGESPHELFWFHVVGDPPAVVFRFGTTTRDGRFHPRPVPEPVPASVTGLCVGVVPDDPKTGTRRHVLVTDCRPE